MSSKSVQSQHKAFVASVSGIPLYCCPLIFAGLLRYHLALLCRGIACMWARLIYEYWSLMLEVWDASNSLCLDMMQMRASRGDCAVLSPQFYKFGSMIPSILSTFCFLLFPTSPRSNILATSFIFLRKKQKTKMSAVNFATQSDDSKICVVMVGLPARGKSLIAGKGKWTSHPVNELVRLTLDSHALFGLGRCPCTCL